MSVQLMGCRSWLAVAAATLIMAAASAQVTLSRGVNMAVDVSNDGRLAIELRGDIWVVGGGGGEARPITQNLKSAARPRWSPDASKIVYEAFVDGRQEIRIYDLSSGVSSKVGGDSYVDQHPEWHPGGERIIYSSDRDGTGFDLWEVDLATGLQWRVSSLPGDETEPAWSANGEDLVYVSQSGQQWSLLLRQRGYTDEALLRSAGKIAAPSWRPDGTLITFFWSRDDDASLQIAVLSEPRLIRRYAANEGIFTAPVSWLDRHSMYYTVNGEIRRREFDSWRSRPVGFRATLLPEPVERSARERPEFQWLDEPQGDLVIHASKMFDGIGSGYQHNKDIVIHGGRIAAVEAHVERNGSIVIDMGDLTVIPGIIDADARLPSGMNIGHGPDILTTGVTTVVGTHADIDRLNTIWSGKNTPGPRLLSANEWTSGPLLRAELDVTAAVVTSRATGLPTGAALATEFRAMRRAGLTPEQTLRAVGVNAAAAALADPFVGRIATGAAADLVFVDGDPLTDINAALNVVAVVRNGRFYSVSGLIDKAKSAESVE